MPGQQKPPAGDRGLSVWVPVGIGVVVIGLIAAVVLMVFEDGETLQRPTAEATTTTVAESTTTSTQASTTSTVPPTTTTTTTLPSEPWGGWWEGADGNRQIDLFIDDLGSFSYWDSASNFCLNTGVESPATSAGLVEANGAVLSLSGVYICHFYAADNPIPTVETAEFIYDEASDTLEGADLTLVRASELPGLATNPNNPLIGSWTATDSDLSHVIMLIHSDGRWESTDTRSGGCERKGFTYASWSAQGAGTFELDQQPTMRVDLSTFCTTPDGTINSHTPDVAWTFVYDEATDTVLLVESEGVTYSRFP